MRECSTNNRAKAVAPPLGTNLNLGKRAVIELTGLRTPCAQIDRFQKGLRSEMLHRDTGTPKFKCGVLGVVVRGDALRPVIRLA